MSVHIIFKLCNTISYNIKKIAIIDKEYSLEELEHIPYYMIVTNAAMIEKCMSINDRLVGIYLDSNDITIKIPDKIKIATSKDYIDVNSFVKSLYPEAEPWYLTDNRPKFHVILQVWNPKNEQRIEELQVAVYKNITNPLIDYIHISLDGSDANILLEKVPAKYMHKIIYFNANGRLTYKTALEYMSKLPQTDFGAIINTDIYFDHTINNIWNINLTDVCLALLRYESSIKYALGDRTVKEPFIENLSGVSQDAWVFKIEDINNRIFDETTLANLNFNLGLLGCDNIFAYELSLLNWRLINPVFSIRVLHLHESNIRSYTTETRLHNDVYFSIMPVAIQNCET